MELKFTEGWGSSRIDYTETEAVKKMNEYFAKGQVFRGHWDNGYSYCGSDNLGFKSGEEVVAFLKKKIAERNGDKTPTDYDLCDYSGYVYCGIRCTKEGRFELCFVKADTPRFSEVSDS